MKATAFASLFRVFVVLGRQWRKDRRGRQWRRIGRHVVSRRLGFALHPSIVVGANGRPRLLPSWPWPLDDCRFVDCNGNVPVIKNVGNGTFAHAVGQVIVHSDTNHVIFSPSSLIAAFHDMRLPVPAHGAVNVILVSPSD